MDIKWIKLSSYGYLIYFLLLLIGIYPALGQNRNNRRQNDERFSLDDRFVIPTPYLPNNGENVYENYEELYPFPDDIPCEQRKRCQRRSQEYELDLKDQNCFCDRLCRSYDDCCQGYDGNDGYDGSEDGPEVPTIVLDSGVAICDVVPEIDRDNPILMVDACPRDVTDEYLRDQCETFYPDEGFLQQPVSGKMSGILYRNVYCALCSGETEVDFWDVEYLCVSPPASIQETGNIDATQALYDTIETPSACTQIYKHATQQVRYCKPEVIAKCDRNFKDKRIKRRCKAENQTSYVYHNQMRIFRNVYCAMCNFINDTYTTCVDDVTSPIRVRNNQGDFPLGPPFSIVIDINAGNAAVSVKDGMADRGRYETTAFSVDFRKCSDHHIYDPFERMCRQIGCPVGQSFEEAQCVGEVNTPSETLPSGIDETTRKVNRNRKRKTTPLIGNDLGTTFSVITYDLDDSTHNPDMFNVQSMHTPYRNANFGCPRISYGKGNYTMYENGSVYIPGLDTMYDLLNYDLIAETVYVCSFTTEQDGNNSTNDTQIIIMFQYDSYQSLVSTICLLVSLVSLLTVFIIYMILPALRDIPGKCIISFVVVLFCAHAIFLLGIAPGLIPTNTALVCNIIGAALHYFFLASFFWMNVLALDICTLFTSKSARVDKESCAFTFYSLYAWVSPALIVGGSVAIDILYVDVPEDYKPHYVSDELCWITRRDALFYLFAVPITFILLVNFILFVITIVAICTCNRSAKSTQDKQKKVGLFVWYVLLGLIMGLAWVFAFLAVLTDYNVLWYVFIGLTALQGLIICLAFICTFKVFGMIAELGQEKKRKGATVGGYYACPNGSANGTITRHTGLYDPGLRMELESHETSI